MDKPEIRFIFRSFPSLKGEKLPKPALFRTRKSLLCLENLKRGPLLVNWDKLNDNNCFYWGRCSCFLGRGASVRLILTQELEGLMHCNPGLTGSWVLLVRV